VNSATICAPFCKYSFLWQAGAETIFIRWFDIPEKAIIIQLNQRQKDETLLRDYNRC